MLSIYYSTCRTSQNQSVLETRTEETYAIDSIDTTKYDDTLSRLPSASSEGCGDEYIALWKWSEANKRAKPSNYIIDHEWTSTLKSWIHHCISCHRECTKRELASVFPSSANILLIDTGRLCLVKARTSYRYIALSYVWGQVPQFPTTSVNLESLLQPNSLLPVWHKLPRTIREAIDLTDRIGERFLWVDSLCIVQDDASLKHHQLQLMAEIYNSATATFIACAGSHANISLVPLKCRHISLQKGLLRRATRRNPAQIRRPLDPKRILDTITTSCHSGRGWTYQERLLSRRCLYFLEDRVIFQCRADIFSHDGEVSVPEEVDPIYPFHKTYDDTVRSAVQEKYDDQMKEINRLRGLRHLSEWPQNMSQTAWGRGFKFWANTIQAYSQKSFTFEEDVLSACNGILTAFQQYSEWQIIQGCPEPLIDHALLWVPLTKVKPREMPKMGENPFPSWSWLKWKGGLHFPLAMKDNRLCEFQSRLQDLRIQSKDTFSKTRRRVQGIRIGTECQCTESWHKCAGLECGIPRQIVAYDKDHEKSSQIRGDIGPTLRFVASQVPASTFLLHEVEADIPADVAHVVSHGVWLATNIFSHACGILYGIDREEVNTLRDQLDDNNLHFILLSDVRLTPFAGVNGVIAPHFAQESTSKMNEPLSSESEWKGPKVNAKIGSQMKPSAEDREKWESIATVLEIPLGTIRNVMLIRWKGDWAERVALGQIVGAAWDEADAKEKLISLR
jgi:hypothetical protein